MHAHCAERKSWLVKHHKRHSRKSYTTKAGQMTGTLLADTAQKQAELQISDILDTSASQSLAMRLHFAQPCAQEPHMVHTESFIECSCSLNLEVCHPLHLSIAYSAMALGAHDPSYLEPATVMDTDGNDLGSNQALVH